jgi:hypothetical protein
LRVHQGISVWPGYVAAVASLVLSLLLLAGVMVFAITQVGRLVGFYNEDLMTAVVQDELRALELDRLQAQAFDMQARRVQEAVPVVEPETARSASESERESIRRLQQQIAQRERELAALSQELAVAQSELRVLAAAQQEVGQQVYRLIFGPGVQGLTDAVMGQLARQMQADGVSLTQTSWVLESGVMGLDTAASREVYRLMLNTRKQLELLGTGSAQVRLMLNTQVTPQSLMRDPAALQPGDVPMLLSTSRPRGGV